MSTPDSSFFSHNKEELLHTLARFDGDITVEDVTDSPKTDNSRYIHTTFLQLLLECICNFYVKNEEHREILLMEVCKRLSEANFLNESLLFSYTSSLRKELKQKFFSYVKQICEEVIPDAEIDFSVISFLDENSLSDSPHSYKNCFDELKVIGKGGFGVVCKARDKFTDTIYAVKKILFKYKNDSRYLRVLREAKNIAALNHPNVVHYNNAWTELPSQEDCDNLCRKGETDNNSTTDDEGMRAVSIKKNESYSSGNIYSSRIGGCKRSVIQVCKETSLNESSTSVIFTDSARSSYENVTWSLGSYSQSETNEHDSSDETDSSESDDSLKLNLNLKTMLYIQMEYCDCDLRLWLDERARGNTLPFEMDVTEIFINILNGVAHIHSKGIIHRDLKPQNIFYSESGKVLKIGDFGLATLGNCSIDCSKSNVSHLHSANIGTLPYAAPEQINCNSYNSKVDIYSLGIMLIELLNTFSTSMELFEVIKEVKKGNFPEQVEKLPKMMNLVINLVNEKPEDRMPAKEILRCFDDESKTALEEERMALREKEIYLNQKEIVLNSKEEAYKEKDKEIARLKALVAKLQNSESNK